MANLNEVQGSIVVFQVREQGETEWKTLVCEEDSQFEITNDVSATKTKCGSVKGVGTPDFNTSGNAVQNSAPTSGEASYSEVKGWQKDRTKLEGRYINLVDAGNGYTEAEVVNNYGNGYFTSSTLTAADGEVVKFSWTWEGVGTLDDYES